jgi:drug/metabolite transporter (DMT)-like permease
MDSSLKSETGEPPVAGMRAHVALLAMALIWALNFSIAKDALETIPPLAFNALRFPLATIVVTAGMVRRPGPRLPARQDLLPLLLLGLLSNVFYQLFFIFGLANTRAGTASVLLSGTPIVTALISGAIGQEVIGARVWIGVVATVIGITFVVTGSPPAEAGGNVVLGNGLLVCATVTWAIYSVAARNLIRRYGALAVTTWTLWSGTAAVLAIGTPALLAIDPGAIGVRGWLAVAYAGALSIGVAYVLWSYGVRHLGPTRTATYSNLVPVLALAGAWLMLGETPSGFQVLGALVIIAGVTAAQIRRPGIIFPPRTTVP